MRFVLGLIQRWGERLPRRPRRRLVAFAAVLVVLVVCALSSSASAQPYWAYSYNGGCPADEEVDPINLVFVGTPSWQELDWHWTEHLPGWNFQSNDTEQYMFNQYNQCVGQFNERATDDDGADQRLHARIFPYGYQVAEPNGLGNGWHLHVTPHHDVPGGTWGCKHRVPPSGFIYARDEVLWAFIDHYPIKTEWWGNTKSIPQCGGDAESAGSDGWVSYVSISHQVLDPSG